MQIVIDIGEKRFRDIQRISTIQLKRRTPTLEQVIASGTPLPKGHGKLIDSNILKGHIDKLPALPDGNFAGNHSALKALINMQPTIIPAESED